MITEVISTRVIPKLSKYGFNDKEVILAAKQLMEATRVPEVIYQDLTDTINGILVTIGVDTHRSYSLSNLMQSNYRIKANGFFDKKCPVLDPVEWIKSDEGRQHISQIYKSPDKLLQISGYHQVHFFTRSRYVWLGYLKHCLGSIDTAISFRYPIKLHDAGLHTRG